MIYVRLPPAKCCAEGQRSHECERGTQECVRHNDFDILRGLTEN